MKTIAAVIDSIVSESAALRAEFFAENAARMIAVAENIVTALRDGHKVLFFGNGGSAADAQHLATELVCKMDRERRALAAVALTTDSSALTAIANDFGFDSVFERQILAIGQPGDVAVGLSTSGNSPNIVRAVRTARELGLYTVAFSGKTGGAVADEAEDVFVVPSMSTQRIQEVHIQLGHILLELVERLLFPESGNGDPR